jgi:uncharacterized protein (TIGR03435 family)
MGYRTKTFSVLATIVLTLGIFAHAQTKGSAFDTVSIKAHKPGDGGSGIRLGPELFSWANTSMRPFIERVFGIKDFQLSGAPGWLDTDKWDIVARTDGPTTSEQKYEMAKALLAERFKFTSHWETRDLPIYALVASKGGPKFREPKDDEQSEFRLVGSSLVGHKWDVSTLADNLSGILNIPVVDKVGLKGKYDFELNWSPIDNRNFPPAANSITSPPAPDLSGPTIFSAIQEQLGLKLEGSKGPVKVLVIDSVQKPTEN